MNQKARVQKRQPLTRRNFIQLAALTGAGAAFSPLIRRLSGLVGPSGVRSFDWPDETLVWQQVPALGISQYTSWEVGYDNNPLPGMLEFRADPHGIFPQKGLWCHIPRDLALEDWDTYRNQLLNQENIVLNDWIAIWEDNRHGRDQARIYIENHLADMRGVPTDPQEREAFLDGWADHASLQRARVYPGPMKDFDKAISLPCRLEVDFWLGNDWVKADGTPVAGWPSITNILSVFDEKYYPIALVELLGPMDHITLFCRSSGDPRPGGSQSEDTILELTHEGETRPIRPNTKISVRCDLWPGSNRDFLVYVHDAAYSPDYVLYAHGQYSSAAHPQVISTHSGLYCSWDGQPESKFVQGTFFLGGYRVWSHPGAQPPATFADVPITYWAWDFIERLYRAGITGGCSVNPLRYCPEGVVTRGQMAVFLLRGIHGAAYTPPAVGSSTGFGDVPTSYWSAAFIKQLAAEGITSGCGNGNYCPEGAVNRAQMAVFLLRAKHGASYTPPPVGASTGFGDVATTYWAAPFIKQLVAEGITVGCGGGNYCPEGPVTRAQMAVFLVRTFNLP